MTFALYFGNRGLFPAELIDDSRKALIKAVTENGYDYIVMDENATRFGAVETVAEGEVYRAFLKKNEGKYDGVILSLPNFGDENGAQTALADCGVPILVQAFPDEAGKMDFAHRRDAFCGKLAICNVLRQTGIPFSLTREFAVSPDSDSFKEDLSKFAAICRTVKKMRRFKVGVFGARTTPFKTTRYDEYALERKGVTVETFDLAELFLRMDNMDKDTIAAARAALAEYANFSKASDLQLDNMARFVAAVEETVKTYGLSAVAIRCWNEFEAKYMISPCVGMSYLIEKGIPASCETDVTNAVMMLAMQSVSGSPVMLLDVNNNFGSETDKCILFHCGVAPRSMMTERPTVGDHLSFIKTVGPTVGPALGRLITGDVTLGSIRADDGSVHSFLAEGELCDDYIEPSFFGIRTVLHKKNLPEMLQYMARNGYKHHTVVAKGKVADTVREVLTVYLGYENQML